MSVILCEKSNNEKKHKRSYGHHVDAVVPEWPHYGHINPHAHINPHDGVVVAETPHAHDPVISPQPQGHPHFLDGLHPHGHIVSAHAHGGVQPVLGIAHTRFHNCFTIK